MNKKIFKKQQSMQQKIDLFFEDYYFDAQGLSSTTKMILDEQQLAKLLTKLAVGSATVWWSLLEIKDLVSFHRNSKKVRS